MISPRPIAASNSAEIRFAVSTTARISGASDVSTPLSAISAIRPSEVSSSFVTRWSALLRSREERSTPLASSSSSLMTRVAMAEIGGRGARDAVDLRFHRGKALLHARDDAGDLLGAFARGLRALRGVAALADQALDLAVEIAHGVGDLMRGLAGGFREVLHLAGDHARSRGRHCRRAPPRWSRSAPADWSASRSPRSSRTPWQPAPARSRRRSGAPRSGSTAATSSEMWLTAASTAPRDCAISPTAADGVVCTACDALAMSWLAETIVSAVFWR